MNRNYITDHLSLWLIKRKSALYGNILLIAGAIGITTMNLTTTALYFILLVTGHLLDDHQQTFLHGISMVAGIILCTSLMWVLTMHTIMIMLLNPELNPQRLEVVLNEMEKTGTLDNVIRRFQNEDVPQLIKNARNVIAKSGANENNESKA